MEPMVTPTSESSQGIQASPPDQVSAHHTIDSAVSAVLDSRVFPDTHSPQWATEALLATANTYLMQDHDEIELRHLLAIVIALLDTGNERMARTVVQQHLMPTLTASSYQPAARVPQAPSSAPLSNSAEASPALPAENLYALAYATAAESFFLNGALFEATRMVYAAREYCSPRSKEDLRALGLLACIQAMNGELWRASESLADFDTIAETDSRDLPFWPTAIAHLTFAYHRHDLATIRQVTACLDAKPSRSALDVNAATLAHGIEYVCMANYPATVALIDMARGQFITKDAPLYFRQITATFEALALVVMGEPGAAFRAISEFASPEDHTVCFEFVRASIYLQLNEPRKALAVTETCINDCANHCLRTLPSVYVRRAVALEMMGSSCRADADFARAVHLAVASGGLASPIGLQPEILNVLYGRFCDSGDPVAAQLISQLPTDLFSATGSTMTIDLSSLSERERVLARWLLTGATLPAIAQQLFVSVNTLKTQSRSLYKKLEVCSRLQAVAKLELAGMTPPQEFLDQQDNTL